MTCLIKQFCFTTPKLRLVGPLHDSVNNVHDSVISTSVFLYICVPCSEHVCVVVLDWLYFDLLTVVCPPCRRVPRWSQCVLNPTCLRPSFFPSFICTALTNPTQPLISAPAFCECRYGLDAQPPMDIHLQRPSYC